MTKQQARQFWFRIHKWLGLTLAILIIPISLTGALLVWHDDLDLALNPERKVEGRATLGPVAYATAASGRAHPGEMLASIAFPAEGGAVVATLTSPPQRPGGRPVRTLIYLDPADARVLDKARSNEGVVQVMHVLHGSLMIPGMGRQIVGWIGVAMLTSSLTGLWLWWPLKGRLARGFRWRRKPETSANLHYQGGFWIALPLAVLSLTGAWISFPAFFASLSGDPAGPSAAERMRRTSARPMTETKLTADQVAQLTSPSGSGPLTQISWPTSPEAKWKASFRTASATAEVTVDDRTGKVTPPKRPQPETTARLMRRIHDGTGMGIVWQVITFIAGIIPTLLAVTGILMWLNVRKRRRAMDGRRGQRTAPQLAAAE